jgi:hypothetical protein
VDNLEEKSAARFSVPPAQHDKAMLLLVKGVRHKILT